ncbi:hypothetical protein PR048_010108 [Dryococelus australis]|uniref:DUF4219 domain-containing protein n=1 Tax=Dryococelus australis TaxID=614101 RepID=A0ABQ9I1V4_9NEOP|nr:hypothetical protein PR048_010108 [Dryococelus australis]
MALHAKSNENKREPYKLVARHQELQGTNSYSSWKFCMELYLTAEDLWQSVTGAKTDENKDQKAKSKICLMIDESLYPIVKSCKTSKQV